MTRRTIPLLFAMVATLLPAAVRAGSEDTNADWVLDGPIDRASTAIHLLVTERACNSGEDAQGRVRAVVELADESVTVTITVVPRPGGHECPSNPATPFELQLPEPLGDRALLDGATTPPTVVVSPGGAPVLTPADAAARVIASDPRFAGIRPVDADMIGQSAWYEAFEAEDGFVVTITVGWGDCPAGCIERHTWQFGVTHDGAIGAPVEGGDPLPPDMTFPTGSGDATASFSLLAGPVCPVETMPPDPECAPKLVAGAVIVVRDATGAEVARLTTDAEGRAQVTLPTGTYVFEPQPFDGLMGTPEAVAASVIGPDGFNLTFGYDTGIR